MGRIVTFILPTPTLLLNETLRMHWSERRRRQTMLAWDIKLLTTRQRPAEPFPRARVRVERHSIKVPDYDGMVGGLKSLLDCLIPHSKRHPNGLGIVADDNPACLQLDAVSVKADRRNEQKTVVIIEELA